jgi:hypothetical protein
MPRHSPGWFLRLSETCRGSMCCRHCMGSSDITSSTDPPGAHRGQEPGGTPSLHRPGKSKACELFLGRLSAERRKLIGLITQEATWQSGDLRSTLESPLSIRGFRTAQLKPRKAQLGAAGSFLRSGGEAGIRTLEGSIESVTYRFLVAVSAMIAIAPVAHCPKLPKTRAGQIDGR